MIKSKKERSKKAYAFVGAAVFIAAALLAAGLLLTACPSPAPEPESPATPKYRINFNVDPEGINSLIGATVDGIGIVPGDLVEEGKKVIFTAIADEDYSVDKWKRELLFDIPEAGSNSFYVLTVKENTLITVKFFKPTYGKVPYSTLSNYLRDTASPIGINYIEITGAIPVGDFDYDSEFEPGVLGQKIKSYPKKKIALKINYPSGVTLMRNCFAQCGNLVSLANFPKGLERLQMCFSSCSALTTVAPLPTSVVNVEFCFVGCSKLTGVMFRRYDGASFYNCFDGDCTALSKGCIKVPAAYYSDYTDAEAMTEMAVPGDTVEEKRQNSQSIHRNKSVYF